MKLVIAEKPSVAQSLAHVSRTDKVPYGVHISEENLSEVFRHGIEHHLHNRLR